ncbi:hypothetical protein ACIO3O_04115 [Streptomyces sp. NPDC087440]|uniref:hypothetical protein n=1 Tax=Streptomyces sp. NPDC087440 TaxID=3365790 RepID=UPI0038229A40
MRFDPSLGDGELDHALGAALAGQWLPAAVLLSASAGDEELRTHRVWVLAELAGRERAWLDAWRAARPGDRDGEVLHALALVTGAWEVRGSAGVRFTASERLAAFHELLAAARPVIGGIARRFPEDSVPWLALVQLGVGLGAPAGLFDEWTGELFRRAPAHRYGHDIALQYRCEKWYGSHEEMFAFADEVAGRAEAGSPLRILPVQAWFEYFARTEDGSVWERPEAVAAVDGALEGGGPGAHPYVNMDRGLLAYALYAQERHAEAFAQFRAIGRSASERYWSQIGEYQGRVEFLEAREDLAAYIAMKGIKV